MALSDNLVSAWELTEASGNRADSQGANTLTDNNTVGSGMGLIYSLTADFEADNSESLSHTDNASLSVGDIDFSFEGWVKAESLAASDRTIVGKGGANDLPFDLDYDTTANRFRLRVSSGTGFANLTTIRADIFGAPSTGTWYQVVCWHDSVNNQIGIAVNAGTADTSSYSAGCYDDGGDFAIGSFPFYGNYWDGLMGPVRFWKRVLTGAERTELYNAGAGRTYAYITGGSGSAVGADAMHHYLGNVERGVY